ncbi:hypothetical protein SLEP1_g21929 [Rubroshorea leprosula]|uniref:Uncharacterized protein n=1 Tax=Rubroshorea leprosula TaxID=152421 RepID=A0AAV5JAP3_9ROSI|nr:hypothetical protein SLEP1_g21929 [Rubroshorea leprosula]
MCESLDEREDRRRAYAKLVAATGIWSSLSTVAEQGLSSMEAPWGFSLGSSLSFVSLVPWSGVLAVAQTGDGDLGVFPCLTALRWKETILLVAAWVMSGGVANRCCSVWRMADEGVAAVAAEGGYGGDRCMAVDLGCYPYCDTLGYCLMGNWFSEGSWFAGNSRMGQFKWGKDFGCRYSSGNVGK